MSRWIMATERPMPKSVPSLSNILPRIKSLMDEVSAQNVEEVCGQAQLDAVEEMDSQHHPSVAQLGQSSSTPPLPVLPNWVTPQSLKFLEKGGDDSTLAEEAAATSVAVVVDEQNLYDMSLHVQVPVCPNDNHYNRDASSDSPEIFDMQANYSPSESDLIAQLRNQLEYYFSRENLTVDTYLRSQMDNDQYVPIKVIANFPKVKRLTTQLDLIVQTLRESPYVQVDEAGEKVRPATKRSTLILRDIADDTHREEVMHLFASANCPQVVSVHYASNNSWYVNFESDQDAQKAFCFLRVERKTFKGKPILARIKTGPVPRGAAYNGGGTPSPQGSALPSNVYMPQMNGYRPPQPPNSLPGLLAPITPSPHMTPSGCTPPPRSENGNSPPQDPIVFSNTPDSNMYYYSPQSVPPSGYNNFDLGQILNMHGYELHATYKPPIIAVPPSTMQQIAASQQSNTHYSNGANSPRYPTNGLKGDVVNLAVPDNNLHLPSDRSSNSSHESARNHSRLSDGYGGGPGYSGGVGYSPRPPYNSYRGSRRGYRGGGGGGGYSGYDNHLSRNYNGRPDVHNRNNYESRQRYSTQNNTSHYDKLGRRPGRSDTIPGGSYRGSSKRANHQNGGSTGEAHRPTKNEHAEHDFSLQIASFPPLPTSQQTSPISSDQVEVCVVDPEPPTKTETNVTPANSNNNNQTNPWTDKNEKRVIGTASFSSVAAGCAPIKPVTQTTPTPTPAPAPTVVPQVVIPPEETVDEDKVHGPTTNDVNKRMSYAATVQKVIPKPSAPPSNASSCGDDPKCSKVKGRGAVLIVPSDVVSH